MLQNMYSGKYGKYPTQNRRSSNKSLRVRIPHGAPLILVTPLTNNRRSNGVFLFHIRLMKLLIFYHFYQFFGIFLSLLVNFGKRNQAPKAASIALTSLCISLSKGFTYRLYVVLTSLCPSHADTTETSIPALMQAVANECRRL